MDIISHENNQDHIVRALEIVKKKQPNIHIQTDDYYIQVWRGANGVLVDFTRIIQYIPMDKTYEQLYFDIVVNLKNQEIIPFDNSEFHGSFYAYTDKDLIALEFIKKNFGVFSPSFKNMIHEEADEYKISCTNEASYGYYTLNKKTGQQGPSLQGSYIPMQKPNLDNLLENE